MDCLRWRYSRINPLLQGAVILVGAGSAEKQAARCNGTTLPGHDSLSQAINCLTNPWANADSPYPTRLTTP